ncbi:RlmE family RNA methyltransferase [Sodalis-like secondary symbiont of Drepanosiphum platanoidis]|uniref:RlmE family RNA methyltransferase n=1 Tax=Sodalis-like secondary symbiont of Drepanosiphum platanoidis TaxID=2994493 RepID=UPI0034644504
MKFILKKKNRSESSKRWLKNHINDFYFRKKKIKKLRSRAWFKLEQIQKKDQIIKPNMNIIELGSSPGGWSQYIINKIGKNGLLISSDILPIKPIKKVIFFQGDILKKSFVNFLIKKINNKKINLIVSDMSPNMSGIPEIDVPKSIILANISFNLSKKILFNGGNFLVKILQGSGSEEFIKKIKSFFFKIKIRKPDASSSRSREIYILALGKK